MSSCSSDPWPARASERGGEAEDAIAEDPARQAPTEAWTASSASAQGAQATLADAETVAAGIAQAAIGCGSEARQWFQRGGRMIRLSTPCTSSHKWAPEEEEELHYDHSMFRAHCPCCWRPLDLKLWDNWWQPPERKPAALANGAPRRRAYVVVVWGEGPDYAVGAAALAQSLIMSGTEYELVCLLTSDVPEWPHRALLRRFFRIQEVSHVEAVQELFSADKDSSRFRHVFTKLHVLSLTEYERVLLLDTDTLVLRNIDDLFELKPPAAMRRGMNNRVQLGHGEPIDGRYFFADDHSAEWAWGQGTGINAGVVLLQPSWHIYQRMLNEVKCPEHPAHVRGNGPEQDYLSRFFSDAPWTHIGVEYNFQQHQLYNALNPTCADMAERCLLLGSDGGLEKIRLAHFSGELKPWHRHFGSGPPPDTEAFVQQVQRSFQGWWLWVRKDEETWRLLGRAEEGVERGEDGHLHWVRQEVDGRSTRGEPVVENPQLHQLAEEFLLCAQRRWDEAWSEAQKRCSQEELEWLRYCDLRSDNCYSCGQALPQGREEDCWRPLGAKWCMQCWWKFEPPDCSRVTVLAFHDGLQLFVDGREARLSLPRLQKAQPWIVLVEIGGDRKALGKTHCFQGENRDICDALAQHLFWAKTDKRWGSAVVVAASGFACGSGQPWSLLVACGGPEHVQVEAGGQGGGVAFAMVGVYGLSPGGAVASAGPDAAVATRRIFAKLSLEDDGH